MDKPENEMTVSQHTTEVLPAKKETDNAQNRTLIQKIRHMKSNITVEPALAFFIIPTVIASITSQNLNLDKACRVNFAYGDAVCSDLRLRKTENHTLEEDEVQKLIASVLGWRSVVHTALPMFLMLFIGAWSDKTGRRKICMLMPIFGEFMSCLFNIINTYFYYEVPVELTVFMDVIFPALTGAMYAMFLGTFSYIGDITSKETRTFRIGILNLCLTIGFPIGTGFSGVLLKYLGYYGVYSLTALMQFCNFCYVYFAIEDHRWLENKDKVKSSGCLGFISDFFDVNCLKETMGIAFKKGANGRRLRICLILTALCLTFGPTWGEIGVMYIFTRYRFHWDEVKYSIFATYSLFTHFIGTIFAISFFSKRLKADDAVLGIISTTSKIFGALIMAFARYDYEVYMSPLVEILNGTTFIALRSIASKLVSYQELGKVNSLFGVAEAAMLLIFTPLYTRVYIATLHFLPGTIFLVSIAATVPALGIFVWFYKKHKTDNNKTVNMPSIPNTVASSVVTISEQIDKSNRSLDQ